MMLKDKLKARRLEIGKTMAEIAKQVGVSEATVSRWENGDINNMRRDRIALYAKALNTSPAFIMGMEEEPQENSIAKEESLAKVYFSFAKEAENDGIDPDDIRLALDMIKKLKQKDQEG